MSESSGGFWTTLPGILTGLASVITAVAGLVYALNGGDPNAPAAVNTPPAVTEVLVQPKNPQSPGQALPVNAASQDVSQPENLPSAPEVSTVATQHAAVRPLPPEQSVDCDGKLILDNTVASLMSWSKHYFEEAEKHQGSASQRYDCEKLLQYRASAWCKDPSVKIRDALVESLTLCRVSDTLATWFQPK